MKSFIPWIGGKQQLCSRILEEFPAEPPGKYVEVFGGGGSMLFSREQHALLEVLNDLDGQLINLYRCVQYHCAELQRELLLGGEQIIPNSRELFFDYLAQIDCRGLTDIQRAARYFYIIRASFGANRRSYVCSKAAFLPSIERLPEIQERLQKVVIENRDFATIIKIYDRQNTLFYLDPPYFAAERFYEGFTAETHERLKQCLDKIKGHFILSYNNTPEIRKLYDKYKIIEVERSNSISAKKGKAGSYKELIIKNF